LSKVRFRISMSLAALISNGMQAASFAVVADAKAAQGASDEIDRS
jgi:hypothetical protein